MSTTTIDGAQGPFAVGASFAPARVDLSGDVQRRVAERLGELIALATGWDGEDAKPIDRTALSAAAAVIAQLTSAGLPEPELFPVPDGGVQVEWRAGPVEIELEFEPDARGFVFVCDDDQVGQTIDGELPRDLSRFALAVARLHAHAWHD